MTLFNNFFSSMSVFDVRSRQYHDAYVCIPLLVERKYDHITPILQSLHWLPIKFRISYKIVLLTYKALNGLAPAYLTSLLSRYNPTRSLRSQTMDSW